MQSLYNRESSTTQSSSVPSPVQRSLWTGLLDSYKQHFGLTEQGSIKGFALVASKDDEGKGKDLFKSVVRNINDRSRPNVVVSAAT